MVVCICVVCVPSLTVLVIGSKVAVFVLLRVSL